MHRLFGSAKKEEPKAPAPSLQEASAKIDLQIQGLEAKIAKADEEVKKLVAASGSNPTAKQRALQALKRKKMYEEQRDQLIGTQFNVEQLAFQQEQAEITMTAVEAMKAGQEQLKNQTKKLDVAAVDKLTDDMADLNDEMKAIGEALAQGMPGGVDEGELEDEYAKLEEEMAAMALAGISAPSAPAATPAQPAAATAAKDPAEEEYARLVAAAAGGSHPQTAARPSAEPSAPP
eukprot:TRINITY_DN73158_c0_g1_i1.p1 TRINITY_DN73158_c0_g1~~TRINITY_DN73158_c0_g1_i1.p1  ORF type:complete len:233 (+),score=86.61 TRINITY_DN73158_c0_g1_i1:69-767(+)